MFEQLLHAGMTVGMIYVTSSVLGSQHSECQRLCNLKTKYVPVHDVPDENSLILPITNLRSGVPIFFRGGKERLIQLLDYSSAAPN